MYQSVMQHVCVLCRAHVSVLNAACIHHYTREADIHVIDAEMKRKTYTLIDIYRKQGLNTQLSFALTHNLLHTYIEVNSRSKPQAAR
jgi:hypothetical protein